MAEPIDVVDGEAAGDEDAGEVEELVEVTLRRKRNHYHDHIVDRHGEQGNRH